MLREFFRFFALKLIADTLIDACNRWLAQGNAPLSVSTAMMYAAVSFTLFKKIADHEAKGLAAIAGYICGGGIGTYLGIVISRAVTGI